MHRAALSVPAVPDPLGRTVRHGHDRGDGLRHPRGCASSRLRPEVVTHGVTGLICDHSTDLPYALDAIRGIEPAQCRKDVLTRFHPDAMAAGYEHAYLHALARAERPRVDEECI
jgi:hypothetical protein